MRNWSESIYAASKKKLCSFLETIKKETQLFFQSCIYNLQNGDFTNTACSLSKDSDSVPYSLRFVDSNLGWQGNKGGPPGVFYHVVKSLRFSSSLSQPLFTGFFQPRVGILLFNPLTQSVLIRTFFPL
jgi:hypothetical protein